MMARHAALFKECVLYSRSRNRPPLCGYIVTFFRPKAKTEVGLISLSRYNHKSQINESSFALIKYGILYYSDKRN
jgi:hypothetical protein